MAHLPHICHLCITATFQKCIPATFQKRYTNTVSTYCVLVEKITFPQNNFLEIEIPFNFQISLDLLKIKLHGKNANAMKSKTFSYSRLRLQCPFLQATAMNIFLSSFQKCSIHEKKYSHHPLCKNINGHMQHILFCILFSLKTFYNHPTSAQMLLYSTCSRAIEHYLASSFWTFRLKCTL